VVTVDVDGSVFVFPDGWEAEVYDTWPLVGALSGGALAAKACDVVAIGGDTLYLIEAKDYTRPAGTRPPPLEDLARTVAKKGFHTLGGLLAGSKLDSDKQHFCQRAVACTRIELCLSVELPADKGLLLRQGSTMVNLRELLIREARSFLRHKALVVSHQHGVVPWTSSWSADHRAR